jgi:hypothetical protein
VEWKALLLLGAYHGINPGMGWLFAVALGMQAASERGVWRALPPIAIGHTAAVGALLGIALAVQLVVPIAVMKVIVACCLATLGIYRLWKHRHPRFGGMQVGFRDLTLWSFLMASAHGAGFMVLPFVMSMPSDILASNHDHAAHLAAAQTTLPSIAALALGVHTLAYLATMTLAALVVYRKLGLMILRSAWINMDWIWACALLLTGVIVLLK